MIKGMIFAERYKLEEFLGQGGMSLVYRAVDIRTGHSVAVKILKSEYNKDKEFLERFQREALAASLMNHHNIVNLLDVGVENDYRYLVLEYVNGNTLEDLIRKRGRLDAETTIQISIRILSALQHAHSNGIIHRDIKPQNVLIHSDGHVKVADFGIARMTNAFTVSKGDTVVGSVHYSSPEQISGGPINASSDIYSTGIVMYKMITGHLPFTGDKPIVVAMQQVNELPHPITDYVHDCPPLLIAVIMKALEKDPSKRFQTAKEMAEELLNTKASTYETIEIEKNDNNTTQSKQILPFNDVVNLNNNSKTHKKSTWIWGISSIMIVLIILFFGIINLFSNIKNNTTSPDVIGMTLSESSALIEYNGLILQEVNINHPTIAAGIIVEQIPKAGVSMHRGDNLQITVSSGPEKLVIPDVKGQNYDNAKIILTDKKIDFLIVKEASIQPVGTVLEQKPNAGTIYTSDQVLELTISGGSVTVPNYIGQSLKNVTVSLSNEKLILDDVLYIETDMENNIQKVISQNPQAGLLVVQDSNIDLVVGVGKGKYLAEIKLLLPNVTEEQEVTVTMKQNDIEVQKYHSKIIASNNQEILVPLTSNKIGIQTCYVYLDNVLIQEMKVQFQ